MTTPSILNERSSESSTGDEESPLSLNVLRNGVRAVAFWSAIALPFLYIPLLISGLTTASQTTAFLSLIMVNVIAVYVGHRYNR